MEGDKVYILEMGRSKAELLARGADEIGSFASKTLARITELEDALVQAKGLIRAWHREPGWDLYEENAPEMRAIVDALAGMAPRTPTPE